MNKKTYVLHAEDHDRNIFDSKYVYPVVSRRAGGLSLGVNLNTIMHVIGNVFIVKFQTSQEVVRNPSMLNC